MGLWNLGLRVKYMKLWGLTTVLKFDMSVTDKDFVARILMARSVNHLTGNMQKANGNVAFVIRDYVWWLDLCA